MSERVGIEELLTWYRDAGVDEPLTDVPVDRFAESEVLAAARKKPKPLPVPAVSLPTSTPPPQSVKGRSPDAVAQETAAIAAACADVAALKAAIETYEGCSLKGTARRTVFAAGEPSAPLVIVSDVPDRDEDAEGVPFAGAAGAMLERMLGAIDMPLDATYRLPASPWRTPGQRPLNPVEKAQLAPLLRRHLELCDASIVLVTGSAVDLVFGAGKRLPGLRGRWHRIGDEERGMDALCTFHPNFLMRQPEQKRLAWADLLVLRERLDAMEITGRGRNRGASQSGLADGSDRA